MSQEVNKLFNINILNLLDSSSLTNESRIEVSPGFIGYAISFSKLASDNMKLCDDNCDYYITFVNQDTTKFNRIQFKVSSYKAEIPLKSNVGDISLVNAGESKCYNYRVPEQFKDDNMIISTILFSGHAYVFFNPGENIYKGNSMGDVKVSYEVELEKIIKVKSSERIYKGTNSQDMYICVFGLKTTSFFIRVIMEKDSEQQQNTNILFNGILIF